MKAFADNPVFRWIQPNSAADWALFTGLFIGSHGFNGDSYLLRNDGEVVAASVWDRPGQTSSWMRRVAALPWVLAATRDGFSRARIVAEALARARPAFPHWRLAVLASVSPGEGFGLELLHDNLGERVEYPTYLESMNERNVDRCMSLGFEIYGGRVSLPGGPVITPMIRYP